MLGTKDPECGKLSGRELTPPMNTESRSDVVRRFQQPTVRVLTQQILNQNDLVSESERATGTSSFDDTTLNGRHSRCSTLSEILDSRCRSVVPRFGPLKVSILVFVYLRRSVGSFEPLPRKGSTRRSSLTSDLPWNLRGIILRLCLRSVRYRSEVCVSATH